MTGYVDPIFGGLFAGRRVLVTGHSGFKGGWMSAWLYRLGAKVTGLSLPPEPGPSFFEACGLPLIVDSRFADAFAEGIKAKDMGGMPIFTDSIETAIPIDEIEDLLITAPEGTKAVLNILNKYGVNAPGIDQPSKITPLTIENFELLRKSLRRLEASDKTGAVSVITNPVIKAMDSEIDELAESVGAVATAINGQKLNPIMVHTHMY